MAVEEYGYAKDKVDDDEMIVRFILSPRHWDSELEELKENFVNLNPNEKGVSCIRHDYLGGKDSTKMKGFLFAKIDKKIPQTLKGWGYTTVKKIKNLAPEIIFFYIGNPEKNPEHVEIRFNIDGNVIKGIVKNPVVLELFDEIESEFELFLL